MSARRSLLVIAVAAAVGSTTVLTSVASGSVPDWSAPKRIPGTAGLVNPDPAVAPDGTELLIRLVSGTAPVSNAVVGRVRLPGETRWRHVPKGPEGTFLSVTDFAPTASGNFWVTYVTGSIGYTSFLVKFNAKKQRWSTPMRLFRDQKDHYHGSPEVEIAADGTLFVEAYAPPKVDPPGDPVARIAVGIRSPSGNWRNRFLTPADDFALGELAVNPAGDAVISFRQGYDLTAMTVRAATKAHGKNARWKIATLSPPGDSQRVHPAIGKDGTAAVVWSATSQTFDAIRMATRDVRRKLEPWVGRDVVTGASIAIDAYGVVNRRGETTVVWRQNGGGGTSALWSRHLDNTGLGPADQLTPNGEAAEFNALVQRPDDKAAHARGGTVSRVARGLPPRRRPHGTRRHEPL